MAWEVWVPYRGLPQTNEALKILRSDGYRDAVAEHGWGKRPREEFNRHAAAVKQAVALRAKTQLRGVQLAEPVSLVVFFALYSAWDDDAGLLAVKWAIDGLVMAGLCRRDRRVFKRVALEMAREWKDLPLSGREHFDPEPGLLLHVDTA